ncbi:PAAR domain-containing protein [Mesorhizobium sp.]|uniref:PAAR domain-containing protein n=1 Tax=Mesorhizobium sp. TaxID=1871066 RepID=UPI000FE7070D|nr:PAAR domain-containing protein [Mesorhizobium sp.]RWO22187.1 MAG: hypothetical protein EOS09_21355 [Mesorhizobium sp.]
MGLPAARVGDLTGHGGPLAPGPGCPTVLIEGKPAWRAGVDSHACPLTTPQPHGAGVVALGSVTVMIGGAPAARSTDLVVEAAGGPNPIAIGAATVLIG